MGALAVERLIDHAERYMTDAAVSPNGDGVGTPPPEHIREELHRLFPGMRPPVAAERQDGQEQDGSP